jgi:hypothetical protein
MFEPAGGCNHDSEETRYSARYSMPGQCAPAAPFWYSFNNKNVVRRMHRSPQSYTLLRCTHNDG